jgi:hypothetical protein
MQPSTASRQPITSDRRRHPAPLHRVRGLGASLLLVAAAWAGYAPASRAADIDVGVSVQISQPGVYGRIDIGRFPQPQVIVAQPVIVSPPRVVVVRQEPVYMWVPQGHRKNWKQHCREYGACGVPVVFVRHDWYDSHVRHPGRGPGRDDDRGHGKDRGNGHGHDKGHGKDRD